MVDIKELIQDIRKEKNFWHRSIDIFEKLPRELWHDEFRYMISESLGVEYTETDIYIKYLDHRDENFVRLNFKLEQLKPEYEFPFNIGDFVEYDNSIWMIYWLPRLDSRLPQEEDCPTRWMDFGNIYEIIQVTENFGDIYWYEVPYKESIFKFINLNDPRITDFMKECRRQRILENYSLFKAKNSEYWTPASISNHHWG